MISNKMKDLKERISKLTKGGDKDAKAKKKSGPLIQQGELGDRPLSRFFYEVSNHHELFRLASSFWEDYRQGARAFAFISPAPTLAKEKAILGIASYFDRNTFIRFAVVGQSLRKGLYRELMAHARAVEVDLGMDYGHHFQIDRLQNVDFIDFTALCELASGDVMFCATGVTTGTFLQGVVFKPWGAITNSMVMRSLSGTIRRISAEHHFDRKPRY